MTALARFSFLRGSEGGVTGQGYCVLKMDLIHRTAEKGPSGGCGEGRGERENACQEGVQCSHFKPCRAKQVA